MDLENRVVELSLDDIIPNRFQPREVFNKKALDELAQSIKTNGVIQPIIVRPVGDKYEIIAGERRYKASTIAGLTTIPCIIKDADDTESSKMALVENIQRSNLTPIEEARTYQTIINVGDITQKELASNVGKTQSSVSNKLRLLTLPEEVQEALLKSEISERHARSLLNVDDRDTQLELLNKVIDNKLSVRELDAMIDEINKENEEIEEVSELEETEIFDEEANIEEKDLEPVEQSSDQSLLDDVSVDTSKFKPNIDNKMIEKTYDGNEVIGEGYLPGEMTTPKPIFTEVTNTNEEDEVVDAPTVAAPPPAMPIENAVVSQPNSVLSVEKPEPNKQIQELIKSKELKMALIGINNIVKNLQNKGLYVEEIHRTYKDRLELVLVIKK